jgi:hypothetical protein
MISSQTPQEGFTVTKLGLVLNLLFLGFLAIGAPAFSMPFHKELKAVPLVQDGPFWVSAWQEVEIPAGLESLQFLVMGSADFPVQITDLIGPDGTSSLHSGSPMNAYSDPVLRNVVSPERSEGLIAGFGTLIYPNNPALPSPAPGLWRFRSLTRRGPPARVQVDFLILGKALSQNQKRQKLSLTLWIAKDSAWGKNSSVVKTMLSQTQENFSRAGIELHVRAQNFLQETFTPPLHPPQEIAALAREKNDSSSLNVYLLPEMEFQSQALNGLACLGGPVDVPGQPCFVALFAKENLNQLPAVDKAKVLTHEIGHYLGLFHTRDEGYPRIGTVYDAMDDTAEEITGANVMDPGLFHRRVDFSKEQIQIMQLSPALH